VSKKLLRVLASDPHQAGQLRKLTVAPEWRLRVGDWRALVLLDEPQRTIQVTRVLPRDHANPTSPPDLGGSG
jgi:mRNA-degrading endonuclease RelE of RelBE toxin-antitoxin system